jgi:hypothetical protein
VLSRTILPLAWLGLTFAGYAQGPPKLGLFLRFDAKPSPTFVRSMEAELQLILSPSKLHFHWFMPNQTSGPEIWLGKVMLRFHGTCAAFRRDPGFDGDRIDPDERISLAHTMVSLGAIQPYTEMNCDSLRDFLAGVEPGLPGEESRLGRAMGRVLAHELYHFLLQTRGHSARGIAKAVYTPAALLGRSLRFEDGELDKIRVRYASASDQPMVGLPPPARDQNTSFAAN